MRIDRLIVKHFDGELTGPQQERLRRRLKASAAERACYDRLVHVLRAASGQPQARCEIEALWRRIARGATAVQRRQRTSEAAGVQPGRSRRRTAGLFLGLGAAALLAVCLTLWVVLPVPNDRGVTLKGGEGAPALVDFDLFAITELGDGRFGRPRAIAEGQTLGLDDLIQFRYISRDPALAHLYLVGVDGEGRLLRYYPRPGQDEPLDIKPTQRKLLVARSLRLAIRHRAGSLTVLALFSRDRIGRRCLAENLGRLAKRIGSGSDVEGVALDWGTEVQPVVHVYRIAATVPR